MRFPSFPFSRRNSLRSCRGVETIELAIILPVFFGLFFGVVDVARMVGGYSTVRAAVAIGSRQAIGTQRTEWAVIPTIMGPTAEKLAITAGTFAGHSEFTSSSTHASWYVTKANERALPNNELYRMEMRAIAYANEVMKSGVGRGAQYPCDDEANCFNCFTLRGDENGYSKYFSVETGGNTRTWTARMLGMECAYQVPISLTSVFMGWLPTSVRISARVYVPVQNYAGSMYEPD